MSPDTNFDTKMCNLKHQIDQMKNEKLETTTLLSQNLSLYLNIDRIEHIKNLLEQYLSDGISEKNILNVADSTAVFKEFRDIFAARDEPEDTSNNNLLKTLDLASFQTFRSSVQKSARISRSFLTPKQKVSLKKSPQAKHSFLKSKDLINSPPVQSPLVKELSSKTCVHDSNPSFILSDKTHSLVNINKDTRSNKTRQTKFGKVNSIPVTHNKSVASESFNLTKNIPTSIFCPEGISSKNKIWVHFCADPTYKSLLNEFTANEASLKELYENYLSEIEKLQQLQELVEDRRNDLNEAKLFKHFYMFGTTDRMDKGVLLENEDWYQKVFEAQLIKYQEHKKAVYELQSLLRTFSDRRKEIKAQLDCDFTNFSMKTKTNL